MFALVDAGRKTEPKAPNVEGESWQHETSKRWKTLGVVCREMLDGLRFASRFGWTVLGWIQEKDAIFGWLTHFSNAKRFCWACLENLCCNSKSFKSHWTSVVSSKSRSSLFQYHRPFMAGTLHCSDNDIVVICGDGLWVRMTSYDETHLLWWLHEVYPQNLEFTGCQSTRRCVASFMTQGEVPGLLGKRTSCPWINSRTAERADAGFGGPSRRWGKPCWSAMQGAMVVVGQCIRR